MNWLEQLKNAPLIEPLGWTILHSLWQGTAIAIIAAVLLRLTRSHSAQLRYAITCFALFSMLIAAIVTFAALRPTRSSPLATDIAPLRLDGPTIQPTQISGPIPAIHSVVPSLADRIRPILPSLALAWIAGVLLLGAYHAGGWMLLRRLRFQSRTIADVSSRAMLTDLIAAMQIRRTVQLCESVLVQVPTVIGWLSPIILLPTSAIIGLSPSELRGLLAHELAHIRRHDYLVNLLQTVIETLLFYHPATWWLGKVIRQERENCCDDLAAAVCDRTIYAQALASMESLRQSPQLALSAKGAALLPRIRRILGLPNSPTRRSLSSGFVSISILVAVVVGGVLLNACRSNAKTPTTQSNRPTTQPEIASSDPTANDLIAPNDPYRIVPSDLLKITINDLQAAGTQTVVEKRVNNIGDISLPGVGSLHAAGDTESDLEQAIAVKYRDANLLKKAMVSVSIVEGRGRTFSILGAIRQPGQYAIPKNDFRLLDALVMAKDVTEAISDIYVIRNKPGLPTEQQRVIRISPDRLEHGDSQENIVILPDDLIQVLPVNQEAVSTVQGRITEAATGKPVPNVRVEILGGFAEVVDGATGHELFETLTTDADGRYQLNRRMLDFTASKSATRSGDPNIHLGIKIDHPTLCSADGQSWWDVTLPHDTNSATKDLQLVPGGKLSGTVNNRLGQGQSNLELAITSKDKRFHVYATTGSNGQFVTPTLFPGDDYTIVVNDAKQNYPQLAMAQVRAGQISPIELHYDPPTSTQSGSSTPPAATTAPSAASLSGVTRVQISQANSKLEATEADLKKAESELNVDSEQIGELQKLVYQREESLHRLQARFAQGNAASLGDRVISAPPTTQPTEPQNGEYYVSGVPRSGAYGIGGRRVTILQALVAAGLTASTPGNLVAVEHEQGGHDVYAVPNLRQQDNGVAVLPGDTLMVVQRRSVAGSPEYYVGGDVPRVGVYSIPPQGINALQAIIAAGADPFTILDRKVEIRHRLLSDNVDVQKTTISDLMNAVGKQPLVQSDDQIFVGKSAASQPTTQR